MQFLSFRLEIVHTLCYGTQISSGLSKQSLDLFVMLAKTLAHAIHAVFAGFFGGLPECFLFGIKLQIVVQTRHFLHAALHVPLVHSADRTIGTVTLRRHGKGACGQSNSNGNSDNDLAWRKSVFHGGIPFLG